MTDDFEKRAREAAERYATGEHSVSFADTHDMAAFTEGTMWARAEMQAEYAETAKQQWRKLKEELERAKGELSTLRRQYDDEQGVAELVVQERNQLSLMTENYRATLVKIRDTPPLQDPADNYAWILERAKAALDGGET